MQIALADIMNSDILDWETLHKILTDYNCPLEASTICTESLLCYGRLCTYEIIEQVISNECDKGNYSIYMDSVQGDFKCHFDKEYFEIFQQVITGV